MLFRSHRTTPCYEAFRAWNELSKLGTTAEAKCDAKGLYAVAAKNGGRRAFLVANVGEDGVSATVNAGGGVFRIYRVDAGHAKLSDCGEWRGGEIHVPADGFVLALSGSLLGEAPAANGGPSSPANGL